MNYTAMKREDFDKSFKYEKQVFLCYSQKKLKQIAPEESRKIVGLARRNDKDTENHLILGSKQMSVYSTDKDSALYKNIGFIPVAEDQYIAVQESRIPFILGLGTMAAATVLVCTMLLNQPMDELPDIPGIRRTPDKPTILLDDDQLNPLPPVDENIEDYKTGGSEQEDSADRKKIENGGGKVTISYTPQADLSLETGDIKMEYQNPGGSSHDAVLGLYVVSGDKEYEIATSGRIPAGKQLKSMQLSADKKLFQGEGKYDAEYRVYYYDPVTGERALAEANIGDVKLIVRNS